MQQMVGCRLTTSLMAMRWQRMHFHGSSVRTRPSRLSMADLQPKPQTSRSRSSFRGRRSIVAELAHDDDELPAMHSTAQVDSMVAATPTASQPSPSTGENYIQPSHYESRFRQHTSSSMHASTTSAAAPLSSMAEQDQQQGALREAFHHAHQRHRIRLRKDPKLFHQECAAFRLAHRGRAPSLREVSPDVDVSLPPVLALKTYAATDPRKSSLHQRVQDALRLQHSVTKNELVQSSDKTLVRCQRCFHVYTARPRTLWGEEVGQSWLAHEKEKAKVEVARRIAQRPSSRKSWASVGRRQERRADDPTCCPMCSSPKAQWMMEYVHYSTHTRGPVKP